MGTPLQRRTMIFIVRVWAEYLAETPPAWRGEVEVVESGERVRFRSLAEMNACIQGRLRPGQAGCRTVGDDSPST